MAEFGINRWRNYVGPERNLWKDEPDSEIFEYGGYKCVAFRSLINGSWNGYIVVPSTHPWFGKRISDLREIQVHGGLTYSAADLHYVSSTATDIPADRGWWLGFDCAHYTDLVPLFVAKNGLRFGTYKDLEFVKHQCQLLAIQCLTASVESIASNLDNF